MNKRLLNTLVGSIFASVFLVGSPWAGQVVTEAQRSWAKTAISQEKALQAIGPSDTLAVLNFSNDTNRPEIDLLQKGLTLMLTTDLSKIKGFRVLERVKLQALLEELNFGLSGLINKGTAPRIGRLLRAAYLVSGRIFDDSENNIRIDPGILKMESEEVINVSDAIGMLSEIFRMEKDILFEIVGHIKKKPLTIDEKTMLQKPMTTSLRALFLLVRGIEHSDRGNYRMAAAFYEKALKADPDLSMAGGCLKELGELGLIFNKVDSKVFLRSLRDRTSLTDRLSPDNVLKRSRTPEAVGKRQSLRPLPPLSPDDIDDDKDGYTENQGDCDDSDATIHPGAEEICDGADNDCDNAIDEGFDRDEDGWTTCSGDCNDSDPDVNPGAAEECYDEVDNNCNGIHDEGCE